jgi:hypothetical protein
MKKRALAATWAASLLLLATLTAPGVVRADDTAELQQIKREIEQVKTDEQREERAHEKLIEQLEQKIDSLENQSQQLQKANEELRVTSQKARAQTSQQIQDIHDQLGSGISSSDFSQAFQNYLGEHQFTLTGGVGGSYIYDHHTSTNTFAMDFEPIILYHLNDWILFEGSVEANLPAGSSAEFALPVATAQIFLNDYLEVVGGIFDQPFGDFYEAQSPFWVNRFVTAPLPYGPEALIPPTDIGVQLRGGVQWGQLGQDVDYTAWVANGPGFDSSLSQPVVGQTLNEVNNIALNTNSKAFGARFRIYPLPLDSPLGRLELGASTLDGNWQNSLSYNAWGVDFAYLKGNLQARGEYLEMYRQMPSASPDNRQGWYVQVGYFLNGLPMPWLPAKAQDILQKFEPLVRYSGVNQRAIVTNEIATQPEIGFSGSPAVFTPHAREVALGLDYWLAPSIVWQNEVDFELPEAGGSAITVTGGMPPGVAPVGATANDVAFLSQLAIGF